MGFMEGEVLPGLGIKTIKAFHMEFGRVEESKICLNSFWSFVTNISKLRITF